MSKAKCPLCELHKKMTTQDMTNFWIERTEDGGALLIMDSVTQGGGINALRVNFCPLCGQELEEQEEKQHETENAELLSEKRDTTDTTGIPENG